MIRPFIDAHVHLNTTSIEKMEKALEYGASFLSINTEIPFFDSIEGQQEVLKQLDSQYPNRIKFVTSFSTEGINEEGWAAAVIAQIKRGLDKGAAGVKIWKNIGMELQDNAGRFIMIDDDRLRPVLDFLEQEGILLIGHQGEPKNCWLPLEEMTVDSDRSYFSSHPEYHMHLHPEYPSYQAQMDARDRVLERHPALQFVGLHLLSMEWSIDEVSKRLDKYPNLMTDVAERVCHLQLQAQGRWEEVRAFMIKYQDRIMYGTDVIDDGSFGDQGVADRFEQLWNFHWDFFATENVLEAPEFAGEFRGLGLPEEVLQKLFYTNAARVYGFD
ncbi:amidohydrolase family protein [Echinicola vietnamensis]|uniref:Putative TIM-barrel fold metal-dependent hydrolase n=1 Tax=Echinicola vietnamensis (strain DSM 17526 / LMG 23754 / KMM 6221) TaxID=926556 RepID=L0FUL5_ECHVK|nr:amidohydrolase family protein [Echinicola vietnamensis]AGA76451.1 putative TIM-barrel fold metal-dependent hydrolase [Echinicola vietnamensis DSM 17526]